MKKLIAFAGILIVSSLAIYSNGAVADGPPYYSCAAYQVRYAGSVEGATQLLLEDRLAAYAVDDFAIRLGLTTTCFGECQCQTFHSDGSLRFSNDYGVYTGTCPAGYNWTYGISGCDPIECVPPSQWDNEVGACVTPDLCPDGSEAPNDDLTLCPKCPDGITPIPSGGVTLCPCNATPYTDKDATGQCYKDCPESGPGPDTVTGKGCLEPKNQKETEKQCVGNPIDIASGEKIQYETPDYQSQGPLALVFERNYQSKRALESQFWLENNQVNSLPVPVSNEPLIRYYQPAGYQGAPYAAGVSLWEENPTNGTIQPPLAGQKQWMHNYQISLLNTGNELIRTSPDGKAYFSNVGNGVFRSLQVTPEQIVTTTLSDGSTEFVYQRTPRLAEYFNSDGQLVRIEQASQVYQDLTYNSEGQLIQIAHSLGASLILAYNAQGQLSQLVTPDNTTVSYSYDTVGNLSQVSKTFSDSSVTTHTYHYDHPNLPYALTGITDESGVHYASWTYNELGQVTQSVHAGGAENTTLSYQGDTSTAVTNALGKNTTYHYQTLSGVKRLTSVEGVASTNCAGANKAYQYNDNGLLKSKTDWLGNTTTYTYNAKHQQISRTQATGTPQQRTMTTVWHESLNLPIKITETNRVIEYSYDAQGNLLNKTIHLLNAEQGEQP